ncbi:MAG: periplasmic protein [Puniceicoccaceae bacterium 5H]|nr:MAG: periplasmic protein [Puniceicoccaceae bacterium 5H]
MRYLLASLCSLAAAVGLHADYPQILVTPDDHAAMVQKVEDAPWASAAYEKLKARVDHYLAQTQDDPDWAVSRLAMNWDTHYEVPVTTGSRWAGGRGHAPVPTPRFAGARDWETDYLMPETIEDYKPYNDQGGKIWLYNEKKGEYEWVEPRITGHIIEKMNRSLMSLAADAGFVYWMTGEERYAAFASKILWAYMEGFSYVEDPAIEPEDKGSAAIIGTTSFEVIHEDIVTPLSLAYDFCHDYLQAQGKDVSLVDQGLKRMIDRVIEGGSAEGNWNLNQSRIIAYGGLALGPNEAYADGKGRPYYVDVVLDGDLPHQRGIVRVVQDAIDEQTALWPEAPGYGFGTARDILLIATLMGTDPEGQKVLQSPLLKRAVPAQTQLIYPNGWSTALGDTYHTRLNAEAAELMISAARSQGDAGLERQLSGLLKREIADGQYDRNAQSGLVSLTKFVDRIADVPPLVSPERTSWGKPLNILIQRNFGPDKDAAIAGALYGTDGGHVHANGLAMELYGAGYVLGPDLGRGSSYWQPDQAQYYSQPPSHNTVIVNGVSNYPAHGEGHIPMEVVAVEPAVGAEPLSERFGFAEASFAYPDPEAKQQRTLALVRVDDDAAFFVDIFRSSVEAKGDAFHDYLYHAIGQQAAFWDAEGQALPLKPSNDLTSAQGLLDGYDYLENERSATTAGAMHARFTLDPEDGTPARAMDLWMPGQSARTFYSVDGPGCRALRGVLPDKFMELPMPTLVVRHEGDAWEKPFVGIYEPHFAPVDATIHAVQPAKVKSRQRGAVAYWIEGESVRGPYRVLVMQNDAADAISKVGDVTLHGSLALVLYRDGEIVEAYLGHGERLETSAGTVEAKGASPASATLSVAPFDGIFAR